ncbi:MAG: hypothetical protein ACRDJ5_04985 [Actinomycetota bacterium]
MGVTVSGNGVQQGGAGRPRRYLVVANQCVCNEELLDTVRECMARGPAAFHVVVPATPPLDSFVWSEEEAHSSARSRLESALSCFSSVGAEVTGEIGDLNPVEAVGDALRAAQYDEILLSTLAPGASRWLKQDLPRRLLRRYAQPLTLVIALAEPRVAPLPALSAA